MINQGWTILWFFSAAISNDIMYKTLHIYLYVTIGYYFSDYCLPATNTPRYRSLPSSSIWKAFSIPCLFNGKVTVIGRILCRTTKSSILRMAGRLDTAEPCSRTPPLMSSWTGTLDGSKLTVSGYIAPPVAIRGMSLAAAGPGSVNEFIGII